jgi:AcrR family transcriptional regulator
MRVSREQAEANRAKILEVAGTLFRERGFDGTAVDDIMRRAGLTHGGFYGHFGSKDDLAAETCARVMAGDGWAERITGTPNPSFGAVIRAYLSPNHRDAPGRGCLLAAVGSDVASAATGSPRLHRRASVASCGARETVARPIGFGSARKSVGGNGRLGWRIDALTRGR